MFRLGNCVYSRRRTWHAALWDAGWTVTARKVGPFRFLTWEKYGRRAKQAGLSAIDGELRDR